MASISQATQLMATEGHSHPVPQQPGTCQLQINVLWCPPHWSLRFHMRVPLPPSQSHPGLFPGGMSVGTTRGPAEGVGGGTQLRAQWVEESTGCWAPRPSWVAPRVSWAFRGFGGPLGTHGVSRSSEVPGQGIEQRQAGEVARPSQLQGSLGPALEFGVHVPQSVEGRAGDSPAQSMLKARGLSAALTLCTHRPSYLKAQAVDTQKRVKWRNQLIEGEIEALKDIRRMNSCSNIPLFGLQTDTEASLLSQ